MNVGFRSLIKHRCLNNFLYTYDKTKLNNKSYVYVLKLGDDTLKIGNTEHLYNRFQNYKNVYGKGEILIIREFDTLNGNKNSNKIFHDKLVDFSRSYSHNKASQYHSIENEISISKIFDGLVKNKFKILMKD